MNQIICVTNRNLCKEPFIERIRKIARVHPDAIILREKDLDDETYTSLARKVDEICKEYNTPLLLHGNIKSAERLKKTGIHVPMPMLEKEQERLRQFGKIGVSVHTTKEAALAEKLGATYLIAGHIFSTDCKKGVPPRGVSFLEEIVESVSIPVYGIGGIHEDTMKELYHTKAAGVAIMSTLMQCENPDLFLKRIRNCMDVG